MVALRALGVKRCAAFPDILTPKLVRRQELNHHVLHMWQELLCPGLEPDLYAAVQAAIHCCQAGLPPPTGKLKRGIKRWLYATRNTGRALISPLNLSSVRLASRFPSR